MDQASRHKLRTAVDEQTLEIRAVEVTSIALSDALDLLDLLDQEKIACMTPPAGAMPSLPATP